MPRQIDGRLFSLESRGGGSTAMRKSVVRAKDAYEADCAVAGVLSDPDFLCDF